MKDDDEDDDVITTYMRIISRCSSHLLKPNRERNLPADSATFMVRQAVLLTFLYPTKEHQDQGGTQSLTKDACRKEQYSHRRTPFHSCFVLKKKQFYFLSSTIIVRDVLFPWKGHRNNRTVLRYLKQHFHNRLQGIRQKHVEHRRE